MKKPSRQAAERAQGFVICAVSVPLDPSSDSVFLSMLAGRPPEADRRQRQYSSGAEVVKQAVDGVVGQFESDQPDKTITGS
jgi:hypothetical protein